jgi:hypothetical protein
MKKWSLARARVIAGVGAPFGIYFMPSRGAAKKYLGMSQRRSYPAAKLFFRTTQIRPDFDDTNGLLAERQGALFAEDADSSGGDYSVVKTFTDLSAPSPVRSRCFLILGLRSWTGERPPMPFDFTTKDK